MSKKTIFRRGDPFTNSGSERYLKDKIYSGLRRTVTLRRPMGRLYGSDAADCPRKSVIMHYINHEETDTPSSSSMMYFKVGDALQDVVGRALEKEGILVDEEYHIPDGAISVGGRVDWVIWDDENNCLRMIEAKTCGKLPEVPRPSHERQAMVYSLITGIPISVFYISRNIADWKGKLLIREFPLNITKKALVDIAIRLATAELYSATRNIPDIPSNKTSEGSCYFCPFSDFCWKGEPLKFEDEDHNEFDFELLSPDEKSKMELQIKKRARELLRGRKARQDLAVEELIAPTNEFITEETRSKIIAARDAGTLIDNFWFS